MHRSSLLGFALRQRVVALGAMLALAGAFAQAAAPAGEESTHEIRDPHYGDTLFFFFQDQYFTSVTNLMVSQHFARVTHHADEAEVLRGGLLLSYGLLDESGRIFSKLIEQGALPTVRDRAWFFLAKIRYQRGYLAEAEDALNHIAGQLPSEFLDDHVLLQSNLLMARADYAGAARLLEGVDGKFVGGRYARYNLGVALIKSDQVARGSAVLDALGQTPAESEELRSLRDRTNVALGFAALSDKQPQAARIYLERVRMRGLQSNKALLGLGWAAQALHEPEQALSPWLELAQRDVSDSAVLEAQIAIPHAYAELGSYGQALQAYTQSIATFARESAALEESIKAIRAGDLVEALYARNPGVEMGWFWKMRELPEFSHANHLAQLLAQHQFQEAFKNYRDLRYLEKNLAEWEEKLSMFNDMLANRRLGYAQRLPLVRARISEIDPAALRLRRDALVDEIARGEAVADGTAFANTREVELLARVARVRDAVAGTDPDLSMVRERVRLAAGALTWQLAQDFPDRLWKTKKALQEVGEQLDLAHRRDAELAVAQRDEPAHFETFAKRIAALTPSLQAMRVRLAVLRQEQQATVQDIAVAELTRQKAHLAGYSTQAQFSVAQLYDRANDQARPNDNMEASHATKP